MRMKRRSKVEWIRLADLNVHPRAQRQLRAGWAEARTTRFDPDKIGILTASRQNGSLLVIDGQHRKKLLELVGWSDQQVLCEVFEGLTVKEEAEFFLGRNDKVAVRKLDEFRIGVVAGREKECAINNVVRSAGLEVAEGKQAAHIRAPASLEFIYNLSEDKEKCLVVLERVLDVIKNAWGPTSEALDGNIIKGLGLVLFRYDHVLDDKRLAIKLAKAGTPTALIGRGKTLAELRPGGIARGLAATVVETYNKGTRGGGLESWWS